MVAAMIWLCIWRGLAGIIIGLWLYAEGQIGWLLALCILSVVSHEVTNYLLELRKRAGR